MGKRIGIVGGGIAGLVAAYELGKAGAEVTLMEREDRLGGLAASFQLDNGEWIEKYYHFICKPDKPYLGMAEELGLGSRVRWVTTDMGLFHNDELHALGDPFSLLFFPHLLLVDKVRFGWATARSKFSSASSWKAIEHIPAQDWLEQRYGERTYEMLYQPLLDLKFRECAPKVSAAWMWARFHRLGNSRTIMQKERLGYLEGGTQVYVDALEAAIRSFGGRVRTSCQVEEIIVTSGCVRGVRCNGEEWPFDYVLSTVPIPVVSDLIVGVGGPYFDNLRQLQYIGVCVMVLRVKQSMTRFFWTNVSDPRLELAGFIEYTNLNPCRHLNGDAILYIPQYLPEGHRFYRMADDELFDIYCDYLQIINPRFQQDWVRQYWVYRDRFAQPICQVGFSNHIPGVQTPIDGLLLTDSYQLHPDDRTVSNSTDLGRNVARLILEMSD